VKTTDLSDHDLQFYLDGMSEEHGELFGVFKRMRRGDYGEFTKSLFKKKKQLGEILNIDYDALEDVVKEIGDRHWYETRFLQELGLSWEYIEKSNQDKLEKRKETKTLMGHGDNRESLISGETKKKQ